MADEKYPSRRKSRKHAIEIGYASIIREEEPMRVLGQTSIAVGWKQHPWFPYCQEIVAGVSDNAEALDELIGTASERWTIDRISPINLSILRVGAWELEHNRDIPSGAVISEAVLLAGELSTEESGKFVNGILASIAAQRH